MAWRFVFFFSTVLGFLVLTHAWLAWRLSRGLQRSGRRRVWGLALASVLLLPALVAAGRSGGGAPALAWLGYLHMGLWSLLFCTVAAFEGARVGLDLLDRLGGLLLGRRPSTRVLPESPERRQALLRSAHLGLLGLAGAQGGLGLSNNQRGFQVVERLVPIAGLDPALEGLRIVQLSDVHVGPLIGRAFITRMVEVVNGLDADLVALTGDLVDGSVPELGRQVAALAGLRSRHGTFFCTGNHEYYSGVGPWVDELRRLGMAVLLNEHRVLDHRGARLVLAGVTDLSADGMEPGHASDVAGAFAGAPPGLRLLLAHQPRSVYAAAANAVDLQLSGHTHGGQYFPGTLLIHLVHPYVRGLHQHGERTWIHVSEGTGWWGPPLRLGSQAEISLLRLVPA